MSGACLCKATGMAPQERANGSLGQTLLQILHPVCDVGDALLLVANLAFDAQWTLVADLLQRLDELFDVRLTIAERHLLAPLARRGRAIRILDMDAADVGAEDFHRSEIGRASCR